MAWGLKVWSCELSFGPRIQGVRFRVYGFRGLGFGGLRV